MGYQGSNFTPLRCKCTRNTESALYGYNGKYAFRNNKPLLAENPYDVSPMKTYQLREGKRLGNIGLLAVVSDASTLLLLPQR